MEELHFSYATKATVPTSTVISTVNAHTICLSSPLPSISSLLPTAAQSSPSATLPLLPQDAVATSAHLQQFSAVCQLTRCCCIAAVYKQKLAEYNNSLKLYEPYINRLLTVQAIEFKKVVTNVDANVNHF